MYARLRTVDSKEVPSFAGDPLEVPDYMRKVELFELVDGGDPALKAVRLMASLKDLAWTRAMETFSPGDLQGPEGLDVFKSFIRARFQRFEIQQEAELFEEYLERGKRRNGEEHRAFGNRYRTMLAKLRKIGVEIPDQLAAFVFWKRAARLSEAQRTTS